MEKHRWFFCMKSRILILLFLIFSSVLVFFFFSIYALETSVSIPQILGFYFHSCSQGFELNISNIKDSSFQVFSGSFPIHDGKFNKPCHSHVIDDHLVRDFAGNRTNNAKHDTNSSDTYFITTQNSEYPATSFATYGQNTNDLVETSEVLHKRMGVTEPSGGNISGEEEHTDPERTDFNQSSTLLIKEADVITFVNPSNGNAKGKENLNSSRVIGKLDTEEIEKKNNSKCDFSHGSWVYDIGCPLYANNSCPFIDEGFACESNGRKDRDYMKWRWKPHGCDIPRFNASKMLELISGKRLVFVGDSINRNQWESLLCLLMSAVSNPKSVYEIHGRRITKTKGNYCFKFIDYKCTVEFYVTHFLVQEGKARVGSKRVQTLRIDTIDKRSSLWKGADILIFNTAHWWTHYKTKSGRNFYQEAGEVHPYLEASSAFKKALMTWASWVDRHAIKGKTRVFFRSSAPSHFSGGQWNSGGHCKEATWPLNYTADVISENNMAVKQVIKHMKTPVTFLDITRLSQYRIDAHPSIYGKNPGEGPNKGVQDCSHWCLPGVPDTWNELLYAHLLSDHKTFFSQ